MIALADAFDVWLDKTLLCLQRTEAFDAWNVMLEGGMMPRSNWLRIALRGSLVFASTNDSI